MAALLLVIASSAGAASLGRLAALSAIGEPLRAEIELTVSPEELETAVARFAPAAAYAAAGLQYNPALNDARAVIRYRATGRRIIDLVTPRAVQAASIPLLIELEVRGVRMLGSYTVTLGAPDAAVASFAPTMVPVTVGTSAVKQGTTASATPVPRAARPAPAAATPRGADDAVMERELQRLQSQLDANAQTLAGMLERVAVMEREVARMKAALETPVAVAPKPAVAAQPAAVQPSTAQPAAAPAPRALPEVAAPAPAYRRRSDAALDYSLLALASGALILLVGVGYWMWGRPRSRAAATARPDTTQPVAAQPA